MVRRTARRGVRSQSESDHGSAGRTFTFSVQRPGVLPRYKHGVADRLCGRRSGPARRSPPARHLRQRAHLASASQKRSPAPRGRAGSGCVRRRAIRERVGSRADIRIPRPLGVASGRAECRVLQRVEMGAGRRARRRRAHTEESRTRVAFTIRFPWHAAGLTPASRHYGMERSRVE